MKYYKKISILLVIIGVSLCLHACSNQQATEATTENPILETMQILPEEDDRVAEALQTKSPTIVISNMKGSAGEIVYVPVYLANNPGILGISVMVSFDDSKLILKNIYNGDYFKNILTLTHSKDLKSGTQILWSGESVAKEEIKDGAIGILEFEIKEDAKPGKTPIMLIKEIESCFDNELQMVDMQMKQGYITISE